MLYYSKRKIFDLIQTICSTVQPAEVDFSYVWSTVATQFSGIGPWDKF